MPITIQSATAARDSYAPGDPIVQMPTFPKLPVLGWSAYAGPGAESLPGVMNAVHRRYTISGRGAIALALQLLGPKPGGAVLVPTYHCPTMVAPVVHARMQPRFYPITAQGTVDLAWLQQADLSSVIALLAPHYFGLPQPMALLREFCDQRGIALIEDCAHAFFGVSDGRPVGSWGDVAIASLTKFFPVPEGGLIVSQTRSLDMLALGSPRMRWEIKAAIDAIEVGARHRRFPGLNSLLGAIFALKDALRRNGAAVGGAVGPSERDGPAPAAGRLLSTTRPAFAVKFIVDTVNQARIVAVRRRNYAELVRQLSGLKGARVLRPELADDAVPYVFPLYVENYRATYQRLRASGIPIFCWDELWPGTPVIDNDCGRDWSTHVFQLGCHQDLSLADIANMVQIVRDVVGAAHASRSNPGAED